MTSNQTKRVKNELLTELWKKRMMAEKELSEADAGWLAIRLSELIDYMQYGHALIAYHKQDGTFCLVTGTLIYYLGNFHYEYNVTRVHSTVVYWNVEKQGWRTFMLENLLEWKPIV